MAGEQTPQPARWTVRRDGTTNWVVLDPSGKAANAYRTRRDAQALADARNRGVAPARPLTRGPLAKGDPT